MERFLPTMGMMRFFALLDAPLRNARRSWGAERSDGAIFHRQWETDVFTADDGQEYLIVAHRDGPAGPCDHGWREDREHIEGIRPSVPGASAISSSL